MRNPVSENREVTQERYPMFASGLFVRMHGLAHPHTNMHTHKYITHTKKRKRKIKSHCKWVILMYVGSQVPVITLSEVWKTK